MFTPEAFIDSFQAGKKQFVNTFVQNDVVKSALNDFVDVQTEYTKAAVKATTEVNTKLVTETTRLFSTYAKVDFNKLFTFGK